MMTNIKHSPLPAISTLLMLLLTLVAGQLPERYSYENQLDINNASFEEISRLPVSQDIAEGLFQRIEYQGPFTSIYQLREVSGVTQKVLLQLKPLIRVEPYTNKTERESRIEQLYFKLDRWTGNEGANQALVDSWLEKALEPININNIRYDELLNLQGVSPVDAAAIVAYREQVGNITSLRDLRSAPNLSYFGYRNARDFVDFGQEEDQRREFHGNLLFRSSNTPFFTEEAEANADASENGLENSGIYNANNSQHPEYYTRFIGSWGRDLKIGISSWHALEEPILQYDLGFAKVPRSKFYLGLEGKKLGPLQVRKVYLGNYSLAFGQGVVMENTDFFQPRKSGFGFRKRFLGLAGDNSRTRQYKLTGAAAEFALGKAHLFLFGSFDERDAILNRTPIIFNGEAVNPVNQFIVLDQRFQFAPEDSARIRDDLPWRNAVKELLFGFHAAYDILPATQIGYTYYESVYDRPLRPDVAEIVDPPELRQISPPDNEIFASYGGSYSDAENPLWSDAKSFRRVFGVNAQSVIRNLSLQAEYAELDRGQGLAFFDTSGDKNPWALVGSAYFQYNSLNFLALYRNYQLGFDNPYQRSFSNYRRYKRTVYEDYFYLQDPRYGQLYTNNPQPQMEEGFYLSSRYQVNRQFVLSGEFDNWRRTADDVTQFRLSGTVQYRPVWPISINLRQKYQGRETLNDQTIEYFENLEFRGTLRFRLSRFSELSVLYANGVVKFRPRPRLFYPIDPGEELQDVNLAGNAAINSEALGTFYTHNFNEWLKVRGFVGYYRGFFWSFEDTQFAVMSSERGAMRYWLSIYSRLSNSVSFRMKYTRDLDSPLTFFQTRNTDNEEIGPGTNSYTSGSLYGADYIQEQQSSFYLELNYSF